MNNRSYTSLAGIARGDDAAHLGVAGQHDNRDVGVGTVGGGAQQFSEVVAVEKLHLPVDDDNVGEDNA
jgi:hypothetical protein